jgi:PIN domain nuclease of toxin-antitoxin system
MRLLLDTQMFVWVVINSKRLKSEARKVMDEASDIYVSAASIWEIAIKRRLRKLEGDPGELVDAIEASGFTALAISPRHASRVEQLPYYHRDPFDRLLIAQAICEPLRLLTADQALRSYSDLVITV